MFKRLVQNYDLTVLFITVFLIFWSIINIYSATLNEGRIFVIKQSIFASISLFIIFLLPFINYKKIVNLSIYLYILGVISLIVVKFFGITILGAKRWISLGFFTIQPSEFMKYIIILIVSYILAVAKIPISWKDLLKVLLVVSIPFALTLKQPDLGTALTILFPVVFIVFLAGLDKKYIIGAISLLLISSPYIWENLEDYQKKRILALINPEADPYNTAYHLIQSKIAIGSGQLFGKGYMQGTQSKLMFLPEQHTDFIFSTIGEEWGFLISALLVILYFVLAVKIIYIGQKIKDMAGKFICFGVGGLIGIQAFINIAMTLGLAPVVGITLPFLSYGGSSLITFSLMIGTVLSVSREYKTNRLQF